MTSHTATERLAKAEGAIEALRSAAEEMRVGIAVGAVPLEVRPAVETWLCRLAEQRLDRSRREAAESTVSSAVEAAPTDQTAQWRAAADVVEAMNEGCGQRKPCASCDAREDAADALRDTARRLAADEQPGVRHVHITIRHPDPTTAHTAALCIADLIRGEYGDSLNLAITTDAPDAGAAPPRPAGEAPDTTADTFAGGSYLTAEHDTLGMIAARHGGDRLAWEMANPWVTSSAMVLPAGLRVAIPAQAGPAAGARQDGAPDDVVTELTEAEFHDAAGKALARLGLTYAELEDQARRRDFSSAQARSLWVTIGGAAPAGARQDGEAQ